MKRTMRFNTEEEMNNYFPDGVPNNVLGIVDNPNGNNVLYTSSNNQIVSGEEEGGFITSPEDLARIAALEEGKADKSELVGLASETWVENKNYLTQHQDLSSYATIDSLSVYALKSEIPSVQSLDGYATEAYVVSKIEDVVGAAPAALDTLKEIGDSLNNDSDFAGTMTSALAGKANAADVYTKTEIQNMGYLTSHQSLADYATKAEISAAGYLTSHQDLSDYALKSELPVVPSLNGYATESYVADYVSTYAPTPDMSAYVSKTDLSNCGYVTGGEISQMGYITANDVPAPDMTAYVSKTELNNASYATTSQIPVINENIEPKSNNSYNLGSVLKQYNNVWANNYNTNYYCKINSASQYNLAFTVNSVVRFRMAAFSTPQFAAASNKTTNLGASDTVFLSTYSYNIYADNMFLGGTDINNVFATQSYVMDKIGAIETVVNAILGTSN